MFYRVKVQFNSLQENGLMKRKYEEIVCNAESFSDAETIGYEGIEGLEDGDVIVISRLPRLREVFHDKGDDDSIYKVTLYQTYVDEKSLKEKRIKYDWLLWANSVDHATHKANEILRQGYDDIHVDSIQTTSYSAIVE